MKKIIILFSVMSAVFFSCKNEDYGKFYSDDAMFIHSGRQQISGFVSNDVIELDIPIYRTGILTNHVDVSVEIDGSLLKDEKNSDGVDFSLLPPENYVLSQKVVSFEGNSRSAVIKLTIDIKKLNSVQGVLEDKFAIPLVLKSNDVAISEQKGRTLIVPVLTGGIKPGSAEVLWTKTFSELGINNTDHNTASLAVTSKYVYVNTRNVDLRYYDRFTGQYVGSVILPFKGSLTNFTVANDEFDNLLITNLRNEAAGTQGVQTIYILRDGGTPEEFIRYSHTYQSGRKLSVVGNLKENALITSTAQNSSIILVWRVQNGVLVSHTPVELMLDVTKALWVNFADAIPKSLNLSDGVFVVGTGGISSFGYFNGSGEMLGAFDLNQFGMPTGISFTAQSLAMVEFNGARYLALAITSGSTGMSSFIIDVTKTKSIGVTPTKSLITYSSPLVATVNNANSTGDVQVRLADDKKSFIMYSLVTNGSIVATKFTD